MKKKKRLIWQIYPSYLLITLVALLAVSFYASNSLHHFAVQQIRDDLVQRARIIETQVRPHLFPPDPDKLDAVSKKIGLCSATRMTVILSSGKVMGDSEKDPDQMELHSDRPEIIEAMAGRIGSSKRYSWTLRQNMIYVAIPVLQNTRVAAVLRTSLPLTSIDAITSAIRIRIALGGLVTAIFAAVVSLIISRRISRPIEEIKRGALEFAQGNLALKLPKINVEEINSLSETLNHMAGQLEARIRTVIRQRNELEAVLSSMVEGVIAVDRDERIINMNKAALNMFRTSVAAYQGRTIQEIIRHIEFQRFIRTALSGFENQEDDISLQLNGERIFHVYSTPLYDAVHEPIGCLIVVNDVTKLRKLENIRRDFAANVSHEIKTPLTAIKGFVETLLHGNDQDPQSLKKFLGIIDRHVGRLNQIVEDLLALSRIEQAEDIPLELTRLKDVLCNAVQMSRAGADKKNILIEVNCDDRISARINPPLFEQAAVNLLENAVKYSNSNSDIHINVSESESNVLIHFRDHGIGIDKRHLPRLFERFYRVDKARSRKEGGTGLGLSIVKHTVQAHGGHITVESTPGRGTTFTIQLPKS